MIKVIERKTSIQIHCTHADWPLIREAIDEGLAHISFEHQEPHIIDEACLKAWKRNGCPRTIDEFKQIDKS